LCCFSDKPIYASDESLYIGSSFPGGQEYYKGLIDDVRIYNRALTDNEVKELYNLPNVIKVIVDGKKLSFDQPPIIQNGRTLVPLRGIFEALDAAVQWDGKTQTGTAVKDQTIISLTIGNLTAYINDQAIQLDQPPMIINGRTLVPVRFVSEALGAKVEWDGTKNTVIINSNGS